MSSAVRLGSEWFSSSAMLGNLGALLMDRDWGEVMAGERMGDLAGLEPCQCTFTPPGPLTIPMVIASLQQLL